MKQLLAKLGWRTPTLFLVTVVFGLCVHSNYSLDLLVNFARDGGPYFDVTTGKFLLAAALLSLCLVTLQCAWRPFLAEARTVKNVLLAGLAFYSFVLVFLLPPFQGPDEPHHWKSALSYCRADAAEEIPLYNLNSILGTGKLHFSKMDPAALRTKSPGFQAPQRMDPVDYSHPLSYPVVSLVSLFFPNVETVDEALLFYYLCRALPILLLLLMLFVANQKGLLPYSAIVFFSFPYVVQQFTVISTDTLANLGTVLAVLLFLVLWTDPRRQAAGWGWAKVIPTLLLWVVCLAVVSTKPPIHAGILLLPMALIPWNRIPYRGIVLPVCGGLLLLAGFLVARWGVDVLRVGTNPDIDRQLQWLASPAGLQTFAGACLQQLGPAGNFNNYCQPLGWVDTYLNPHHLILLYASALAALLLDLLHWGPRLPAALREKTGSAVLMLGIILVNFLFLLFSLCFVGLVAWSPPRATSIVGIQTRYLFPGVIVALFLPLAVLDGRCELGQEGHQEPAGLRVLLPNSSALSFLGLLLFARTVELTIDLLVRYW